ATVTESSPSPALTKMPVSTLVVIPFEPPETATSVCPAPWNTLTSPPTTSMEMVSLAASLVTVRTPAEKSAEAAGALRSSRVRTARVVFRRIGRTGAGASQRRRAVRVVRATEVSRSNAAGDGEGWRVWGMWAPPESNNYCRGWPGQPKRSTGPFCGEPADGQSVLPLEMDGSGGPLDCLYCDKPGPTADCVRI